VFINYGDFEKLFGGKKCQKIIVYKKVTIARIKEHEQDG
jgi:hypothetical protein